MEPILSASTSSSVKLKDLHSVSSCTSLAETYDRLCSSLDDPLLALDEKRLQMLDDSLWGITQTLCREIERVPHTCDDELASFRHGEFSSRVLEWFRRHEQTARLWNKPAGYSGDHATIEWLCADTKRWDRLEDVFANQVLRCTMAQQHRNKVTAQEEFVSAYLNRTDDEPVTIVDFGCGPSIALRRSFSQQNWIPRTQIILVDLDPQALSFSRSVLHLLQPETVSFTYLQADVVQGLRGLSRKYGTQTVDAIMFGGLFDYLPDRIVTFVLRKAMGMLSNSGRLFFSQVSPSNPDRTFMDWFGDWRLIERDELDLLRLCQEAGLPNDRIVLSREPTGCAILATVTK